MFNKDIEVKFKTPGGQMEIVLRWPTNEEWNVYSGRKTEYTPTDNAKGVRTCEPEAKAELFDKIVKSAKLGDGDVKKEDIPSVWKGGIIDRCIDAAFIIDVKNC